jgi:pentapeptide repeat protein
MLNKLIGRSKPILIRQMASRDNKLALQAVEALKARGWFRDGSLQCAHLERANLCGAALAMADLERAVLRYADLSRAYLGDTNLRGADMEEVVLHRANLRNVILREANLTRADLRGAYAPAAQLHGANLGYANLQECNFWQAALFGVNLQGADMVKAIFYETAFDSSTVLPDGTSWSSTTDLRRFTDPASPNFWSVERQ